MNTAALIAASSVLLGACAATAAPAPVAPPQAIDPMIRDGVIVARLSIPDGDQPAIEAGFWVPTDEAAKPLINAKSIELAKAKETPVKKEK